jgi:hypothetical protein
MSKKQNGQVYIEGQFVGLRYELLDSPAWKYLSMGARLLYIALLRQLIFRRGNNGHIYLSNRTAMAEIGTNSFWSITKWFRELQHYGFIEQTEPAMRGSNGRAARWRLTDVAFGELDGKPVMATKNYLRWSGELFDPKKHFSCTGNDSRGAPKIAAGTAPEMIAGDFKTSAKTAPEMAADLERLSISLERSGGARATSQACRRRSCR